MQEIERKFVLDGVPAIVGHAESIAICQYYVPADPGELRLRQAGSRYFLTVKSCGGLIREEWEVETPTWVFELLKVRYGAACIAKHRFEVVDATNTLIVDVYGGRLQGLVILECEFSSVAAAEGFRLPEWARGAREVTSDPRYKNRALAFGAEFSQLPRAAP